MWGMLFGKNYYLTQARHQSEKRNLEQAQMFYEKVKFERLPLDDKIRYAVNFHDLGESERALMILNQILLVQESDYAYERRAHILIELDREEEGVRDLEKSLAMDPDRYMNWYTKGLANQNLQRYPEAIHDFKQCIQRENEETVFSTYYELGKCYYRNEQYEEAITVFQKIVADPNKELPIYYYWLAATLEQLEDIDAAIEAIEKGMTVLAQFEALPDRGMALTYERGSYGTNAFNSFITTIEENYSFTTELADLHFKKEQYKEAITAIEEGMRLYPDDVGLFLKRGGVYEQMEKPRLAEADYKHALQLDPDHFQCYFKLGDLYRKLGEEEKNIQLFLQLVQLHPKFPVGHYRLADAYYFSNQYEEALAANHKLLELETDDYLNFLQQGVILVELGRYQEAEIAYSQGIELYDYDGLRMKRSYAYFMMDQLDSALHDLQTALAFEPQLNNSDFFHNGIGTVYKEMRQWELAINHFSLAIRLDPDQTYLYEKRADCYYQTGQMEAVIVDCSEGIKLRPDQATFFWLRGLAHYNQKNYEQALADSESYSRLLPDAANGYYNIAACYNKLDQEDKALHYYSKAIAVNPFDPDSYIGRAYIYYNRYDYDLCVQDLVNWALYMDREASLERRIMFIEELEGFDEDIRTDTVYKLREFYREPTLYS